jgi:hypothetical protein
MASAAAFQTHAARRAANYRDMRERPAEVGEFVAKALKMDRDLRSRPRKAARKPSV